MPTPRWFSRDISLGDKGKDVDALRRLLKLGVGEADDNMFFCLEVVVGHPVRVVTSKEAETIGPSIEDGLMPDWYVRRLDLGDVGFDVEALNGLLGVRTDRFVFTESTSEAIRRWQSANALEPDGLFSESLAFRLGNITC